MTFLIDLHLSTDKFVVYASFNSNTYDAKDYQHLQVVFKVLPYKERYWFVKYHITIIQNIIFCTQCQTTFKIRYRSYKANYKWQNFANSY